MSLKTSGAPMSLVLPFTPASAGVARHELGRWLEQLANCDDDEAGDCALVVSELVGNAVRHAQPLANGTVEVSWHKQPDGVDIAVTDGDQVGLRNGVAIGERVVTKGAYEVQLASAAKGLPAEGHVH